MMWIEPFAVSTCDTDQTDAEYTTRKCNKNCSLYISYRRYMSNTLKTATMITSGQSNLTERPHRRRTWTVQWYSPNGASVTRHLINACLSSPESKSQTASRSVQLFLHSSRQTVAIFYNGRPLTVPPSRRGSGPPTNTWFLGPTWILNSNGISIGLVVFLGLTTVTDRQTDRRTELRLRYSVYNSRLHLRT